jgi:diphthamide biosynthesis protein 3
MTAVYDEVEIEDFEYSPLESTFYYPCPCGDRFQITVVLFGPFIDFQDELCDGEEVARCPSCSLMLRIIYDAVSTLYLAVYLLGFITAYNFK